MGIHQGIAAPSGGLSLQKIYKKGTRVAAPWQWQVKNRLRTGYIWGYLTVKAAELFSKITGLPVVTSSLRLVVIKKNNLEIDYGIVGRRVVTDAGVAFIVDAFDNTVELEIMNYHAIGTGSTAEAVGDTALVTELTTEYTPDSTRDAGTQSQPSANIYQTLGLNTLSGAGASLREHGVMSQAATGGGVLLDRTVYALITLNDGDALQSTYQLTFTSGG